MTSSLATTGPEKAQSNPVSGSARRPKAVAAKQCRVGDGPRWRTPPAVYSLEARHLAAKYCFFRDIARRGGTSFTFAISTFKSAPPIPPLDLIIGKFSPGSAGACPLLESPDQAGAHALRRAAASIGGARRVTAGETSQEIGSRRPAAPVHPRSTMSFHSSGQASRCSTYLGNIPPNPSPRAARRQSRSGSCRENRPSNRST